MNTAFASSLYAQNWCLRRNIILWDRSIKNQGDLIFAMAQTHVLWLKDEVRQNKTETWLTDVSIKAQLKQSYLQCTMNILAKRDICTLWLSRAAFLRSMWQECYAWYSQQNNWKLEIFHRQQYQSCHQSSPNFIQYIFINCYLKLLCLKRLLGELLLLNRQRKKELLLIFHAKKTRFS